MNDKLTALFFLCLNAKKVGLNVFFQYFPHVNNIDIYCYRDFDNSLYPDEVPDYVFRCTFYLDRKDTDENITRVTETIENLISERKTKL